MTRSEYIKNNNITFEDIRRYEKRKNVKQIKLIKSYHNGEVLQNTSRGRKNIIVFKFNTHQYGVNVYRSGQYSLDDGGWDVVDKPFGWKLWQIVYGKSKKLNFKKKAILAGI